MDEAELLDLEARLDAIVAELRGLLVVGVRPEDAGRIDEIRGELYAAWLRFTEPGERVH